MLLGGKMYYKTFFINKTEDRFLVVGKHDLDSIQSRNDHEVNLAIEMDAFQAIRFFPNIEKLVVLPGEISHQDTLFLRGLNIRFLKLDYYSDEIDEYTMDLREFPNVEILVSRTSRNFSFLSSCTKLRTLIVEEWQEDDFTGISGCAVSALKVLRGKLRSLCGLESLPNLCSLSLSYQRRLADVGSLARCDCLESLQLEKCPRIKIMELPPLPQLQFIFLSANDPIDSLTFLKQFPKLRYCILDVKVLDGNMQYLEGLEHVVLLKGDRKTPTKTDMLNNIPSPFHSSILDSVFEVIP